MTGPSSASFDLLRASIAGAQAAVDAFKGLPPEALAQVAEGLESANTVVGEIGAAMAEVLRTRTDVSPMAYRSLVAEHCFAVLEACARHERALRRVGGAAALAALQDKLTALSELLEKSAAEAAVAAASDGGHVALPAPAMPGEGSDVVFID